MPELAGSYSGRIRAFGLPSSHVALSRAGVCEWLNLIHCAVVRKYLLQELRAAGCHSAAGSCRHTAPQGHSWPWPSCPAALSDTRPWSRGLQEQGRTCCVPSWKVGLGGGHSSD